MELERNWLEKINEEKRKKRNIKTEMIGQCGKKERKKQTKEKVNKENRKKNNERVLLKFSWNYTTLKDF